MSHPSETPIPRFPTALAQSMRALPLAPLSLALSAYAKRVAKTHPAMFKRLGEFDQARFLLDPTDLPIVLQLDPNGGAPKVRALRKAQGYDARVAGPLAALLGLVHGAYDGDALFFSRDLVIEGDTGAALALRNAVDDAELDFSAEIAALSGPFARPLKKALVFAQRQSGVFLSRPEEAALW